MRDVSVSYGTSRENRVEAVSCVDMTLESGVSVGIVGESGSGKSTLGKALLGLLPQNTSVTGEVWLGDSEIAHATREEIRSLRWTYASTVFQDAMSALNPVMRVGIQIREAIRLRTSVSKRQSERRARELLERVGIGEARYHAFPHELSGGQRQRVMIAIAISCEPALLVADEPTTALDVVVQAEIVQLLEALQRDLGLALVFISHDLGVVSQVANRLLVMYSGQVVESGPTEEVIEHRSHPYTRALIGSFPRMDGREVVALPPNALKRWTAGSVGCRFVGRCPFAQEICSSKEPPAVEYGSGSWARCHFVGGTSSDV